MPYTKQCSLTHWTWSWLCQSQASNPHKHVLFLSSRGSPCLWARVQIPPHPPRYIWGILLRYHCISDFKMESYKVTGKMCVIVKDPLNWSALSDMSRTPLPLPLRKHSHPRAVRVWKVPSVGDLSHYRLVTVQLEQVYQSSSSTETKQQQVGHGADFWSVETKGSEGTSWQE